jgi:D-alanyl-D-alanine carboxypeptidase (penicillin-binding protein 5/6)
MAMLSYGFRTYTTVIPDLPPLPPLRVWKGRDELVGLTPARPIAVTASRNETETLAYSVVTDAAVVAPIRKGETVGHLVFSSDGKEIGRVDLAADRDVEPAGVLKRAWDSVQLEVSQLRAGLIPRRPSESGRSPALDAARPPSGPASPEAAETRPSPTALARGTPK